MHRKRKFIICPFLSSKARDRNRLQNCVINEIQRKVRQANLCLQRRTFPFVKYRQVQVRNQKRWRPRLLSGLFARAAVLQESCVKLRAQMQLMRSDLMKRLRWPGKPRFISKYSNSGY